MVLRLATIPESFSILPDSATQPKRPSVKWDLGLDFDPVAKETTAPGLDFRRERLDSQPDIGVRVRPQIFFLRPRSPIPKLIFSMLNSSDANVRKLLPKSHLSRVIIRDNLNAQRIYEMEMKESDKTKKKMSCLHDHLKKKFMTDQLRKMWRWRRESLNTQQYLDRQRDSRGSTASPRSSSASRGSSSASQRSSARQRSASRQPSSTSQRSASRQPSSTSQRSAARQPSSTSQRSAARQRSAASQRSAARQRSAASQRSSTSQRSAASQRSSTSQRSAARQPSSTSQPP